MMTRNLAALANEHSHFGLELSTTKEVVQLHTGYLGSLRRSCPHGNLSPQK